MGTPLLFYLKKRNAYDINIPIKCFVGSVSFSVSGVSLQTS